MKARAYNPEAVVISEDRRIHLPAHFVSRISWLKGEEPVEAWLVVVGVGRYRLLSLDQVNASPLLKQLRMRIEIAAPPEPETGPINVESPQMAALAARLFPATLSHGEVGWRITLPKDLPPAGAIKYGSNLVLLFSQGYLELWTVETLSRSLETPLDQLLG